MRYINTEMLRPSRDWLDRAGTEAAGIPALRERLATAETSDEKKEAKAALNRAMARCADLWSELKPELEALSFGKCWYCEGREERSNLAVDHFRPKSRVYECPDHPGYWWLALDHSNYRYACTLCNSLLRDENTQEVCGKGTHFPLMDESQRLFRPEDPNREVACILDPTVAADPSLLWFMNDGQATPRYRKERSPLFFQRAETSISVYNLNHPRISEHRSMIAFEIKHQVERGEKYLDDAATGDGAAQDHFQEVFRTLLRLVSAQAPYSASARAILCDYRDKDWVETALATA